MKYLFLFLPLFCFGQTTKTLFTSDSITFATGTEITLKRDTTIEIDYYKPRPVNPRWVSISKPVVTRIYNDGKPVNTTSLNRINVFTVAAEFAKEDNKACLNLMGMLINCATHCEDEAFAHFYENTYPQYLKDLFKNPSTAYCAFQIYSKL